MTEIETSLQQGLCKDIMLATSARQLHVRVILPQVSLSPSLQWPWICSMDEGVIDQVKDEKSVHVFSMRPYVVFSFSMECILFIIGTQ
jgi:hypothetical protein